jgi:hypothetical protein
LWVGLSLAMIPAFSIASSSLLTLL